MRKSLESSLIRICKPNGKVVGAGFLVSENYVLTCAHVVAQALGISSYDPERPDEEVCLDFPLVKLGEMLKARVIIWREVQKDEASPPPKDGEDIAVLELKTPLPTGAKPIPLIDKHDLEGHKFDAYGFPDGHDKGAWTSGVLCRRQGAGWVQLEAEKETGLRVEPGFSGTPIWDKKLKGVVGIAVAADLERVEAKVAFMIPTDLLVQAWSRLGEKKRFQLWRDLPWVWASLVLFPFIGMMVFVIFQSRVGFDRRGVPMMCDIEPQPQSLKIVIANFAKSDGSLSRDGSLENQLEAELTQQLGDDVVVCRVEEIVLARGEARKIGEQSGADLVIWGNRGESFTGGIESVSWEVEDQDFQLENSKEQSAYLHRDFPNLVALQTNLILSQIYDLQDNPQKAQNTLSVAIQEAQRQGLEKSQAKQLAKAYFILGLLYEQTDSLEQALNAYQQAFSKDKTLHIALLHQGTIFQQLKKLSQAEKAYEQVINSSDPTLAAAAFVNRASLRLDQSNYGKAEEDFEQAIILNESFGRRARAFARLYKSNDIQGSIADCKQLIYRLKSKNPIDYQLLGEAQLKAGDVEGAKETYRKALPFLTEQQRNSIISKLNSLAQERTELKDDIAAIITIFK